MSRCLRVGPINIELELKGALSRQNIRIDAPASKSVGLNLPSFLGTATPAVSPAQEVLAAAVQHAAEAKAEAPKKA